MRVLLGGVLALLLLTFLLLSPPAAATWTQYADVVGVSEHALIRADSAARAGDFIKPEAAQRSLAQRTDDLSRSKSGQEPGDGQAPSRISPVTSIQNDPAPPSASVRRAHLLVYRL